MKLYFNIKYLKNWLSKKKGIKQKNKSVKKSKHLLKFPGFVWELVYGRKILKGKKSYNTGVA